MYKYFICFLGITLSLASVAQTTIKADDPLIQYSGRVAIKDGVAELSWSATSVKINFTGSNLDVTLSDERSDNNYDVLIDGKVHSVLHPLKEKQDYTLAEGLQRGNHTVELFKRTEWAMGKTWLYDFSIVGNNTFLPQSPPKTRKMEVFGNSISCGYADIDFTGQDRGTSPFEDAYIAYPSIIAQHFDAELHNTSRSGIGITVSWAPLIMPEMYDRLDATDPNSKWDFKKYAPDLVIINLFQNDKWLIDKPTHAQFKARFGDSIPKPEFIIKAYQNFVKKVRVKYPAANIICMLGSMDATSPGSPYPGYIEKAVAPLNDKKIYTHFIPYKGTNGHPSMKEQQAMADDLTAFIEKNIVW
jgi:hypothetical protein